MPRNSTPQPIHNEVHDDLNIFGETKTKLLKYLLTRNKQATAHQVREDLFPDKQMKYVNGILYEAKRDRLITKEESINNETATIFKANLEHIAGMIDVVLFAKTGKFVRKQEPSTTA